MSVLSAGQFFGETSDRRVSAGFAVSRLDHCHGRKLPMHVHEQPYFSMVLDGGYREQTGRRSIDYDPMTIVYHPPGTAHVDEIGPLGARFLMIETDRALVEAQSRSQALRRGYPIRLSRRAGWTALELLRETVDPVASEAIALDLLGEVDDPRNGGNPPWLGRALERIRDEFVSPPTTAELAREAGIHPVHLARVVRRETGITLADHVRQRRVEQSIPLLRTTEPLASIALRVGFADQAHFTRAFRRVTRFTPAELRRAL